MVGGQGSINSIRLGDWSGSFYACAFIFVSKNLHWVFWFPFTLNWLTSIQLLSRVIYSEWTYLWQVLIQPDGPSTTFLWFYRSARTDNHVAHRRWFQITVWWSYWWYFDHFSGHQQFLQVGRPFKLSTLISWTSLPLGETWQWSQQWQI